MNTNREENRVPNVLSRRNFIKVATVGLGVSAGGVVVRESHQDYSDLGKDLEIQSSLEKRGVKNVHLRIYLGHHYFTPETSKKMDKQNVSVISGEMIQYIPQSDDSEKNKTTNLSEEFFKNLLKVPTGVTASGQMDEMKARSQELLRTFSKNRKAVLATDAGAGPARTQEAASRVTVGWGAFALMLYFAGLGWKTGIVKDYKNEVSRRQFLKGTAAGGIAVGVGILANALYTTGENRGIIEPVGNTEVSYIYSKLFDTVAINTTEFAFALAGDERLKQAFNALIKVRNQVISLNHWFFIESLQRNKSLRQCLVNDEGIVEIGFFAGNGHASIKAEFCKGPEQLSKEIGNEVNNWLDQYVIEMQNEHNPDKRIKITDYYCELMKIYGKSKVIPLVEIDRANSFTDNFDVTCQTPAAIMFRILIQRVKHEQQDHVSHCKVLLQEMIKQQHLHDGTYRNVSGKILLEDEKYKNILSAGDPNALKKRFSETMLIPNQELDSIQGEIYPNLYQYDYIGSVQDKQVNIGLAIVQGIPMTYFQKEDISFIKNQLQE